MNILEFFPNLALVEFALGEDWVYYLVADVGTDLFYNSWEESKLVFREDKILIIFQFCPRYVSFFTVYVIIDTIQFLKVIFVGKLFFFDLVFSIKYVWSSIFIYLFAHKMTFVSMISSSNN